MGSGHLGHFTPFLQPLHTKDTEQAQVTSRRVGHKEGVSACDINLRQHKQILFYRLSILEKSSNYLHFEGVRTRYSYQQCLVYNTMLPAVRQISIHPGMADCALF